MPPPEDKPPADGLARFLLALLMVLAPGVYVARLAMAEPVVAPRDERPLWAQVVVLTVGHWPDPARLPAGPAFQAFASGAIDAGGVYVPTDVPGPAAVSLWTGRFPEHHGVLAATDALPEGTWTLAQAGVQSGAHTAAFLEGDFVTRHAIGGFELVREDPSGEGLAEAAAQWLRDHAGERKLLWLHLEEPGQGGARLDGALAKLQEALVQTREEWQTLTLFTALSGPARGLEEAALRVPLWLELPNKHLQRRSANAQLSQIDLCGALQHLLRWPGPSIERGQRGTQSRWQAMQEAMQGGSAVEPIWITASFGEVARFNDLRVLATPSSPGAARTLTFFRLPRFDAGPAQYQALPVAEQHAAEDRYIQLRSSLLSGRTAAAGR